MGGSRSIYGRFPLFRDRCTCCEAAFLWICMRLIIVASADENVDGMPQILGFTSMVSPKAVSIYQRNK
jgi:hypothetical protein